MYRMSIWASGAPALLIFLGFVLVLVSSTPTPIGTFTTGPALPIGVVMILLGFGLVLGNSMHRWTRY
jgi:hypothetical protein